MKSYSKVMASLVWLLLLGCRSEKATLFKPAQIEKIEISSAQVLLAPAAVPLPMGGHLYPMGSTAAPHHPTTKVRIGLRAAPPSSAAGKPAASMSAANPTQATGTRLPRQKAPRQPAEHEFPELFVPAIVLGLIGGVVLVAGVFSGLTLLAVGAGLVGIAALLFFLS